MYYGPKKLQYSKIYGFGTNDRDPFPHRDRWAETESSIGGPPKDFIVAITEWIDESLPRMIKQAINFRKSTRQVIYLSTNPDYASERRSGSILFSDDRVIVQSGNSWSEDTWTVEVLYADPKMFDQLLIALKRFYNNA